MKELLQYIIKGITGSEKFEITETTDAESQITLTVIAPKEIMGIIIGKGGNTIKSIQNLVRVKARLENKFVFVNIEEEPASN